MIAELQPLIDKVWRLCPYRKSSPKHIGDAVRPGSDGTRMRPAASAAT